MKYWFLLLASTFVFSSCEQNTTFVQEKMVIDPHTVVFAAPDTAKTISITHTCTCPFYWNTTDLDTAKHWLKLTQNFPAYRNGDWSTVPISIDRSQLMAATDTVRLQIASNSYGWDTIRVVAIK